jgi:hypothetical protein
VTYASKTRITNDIIRDLSPIIERHRDKLIVTEYDVITLSKQVGSDIGFTYALVTVVVGALLGRENWLQYVFAFGPTVGAPDARTLEQAVSESCDRLRTMQVLQLRHFNSQPKPPSDPTVN